MQLEQRVWGTETHLGVPVGTCGVLLFWIMNGSKQQGNTQSRITPISQGGLCTQGICPMPQQTGYAGSPNVASSISQNHKISWVVMDF